MLTNRLNDATKVFIIVSTVIVVCVLCAVGFKLVNEGKSSVNASTNNFNNMTSQYSEIDLAIYDGSDVMGSEVLSLIRRVEGEEVAIGVKTKKIQSPSDYTYYNKKLNSTDKTLTESGTHQISEAETVNNDNYINLFAQFRGSVVKNDNGIIVAIKFEQISK